jgi:sialate O-acetylesterase
VYGRAVEIYGPVYKSHKIDGGKVTVTFDHVGKGLAFKAEAVAAGAGPGVSTLQGFALAGEKGAFVWADAVIEGNTVVVSSDKVPQPVSVRYAWASQHRWANLFNKDGLPALPFRTDSAASVKPAH